MKTNLLTRPQEAAGIMTMAMHADPNACESFAGFAAEPPDFRSKDGPCGPVDVCSVTAPVGPITKYLSIPGVPALAAGVPGRVAIRLFTGVPAALMGLSAISVYDNATGAILTPDDVYLNAWNAGTGVRQVIPGWGADSTATNVATGAAVVDLASQAAEDIEVPLSEFAENVLRPDVVQNNLPIQLQKLNMARSQGGVGFTIVNRKNAAIRVLFKTYLAFNAGAGA